MQHHGEQMPQAEAQAAPEGWAEHHQGYTDPLTGQYHPPDPKMDVPTGWDDHNPNDPPGGGGVSDNPNAGPQDFSGYDPQDGGSATKRRERDWYDQPAWQRNRPGNPAEAVRFGQRYVETADPANNMEQPSQWQGRTVGQEGQYPPGSQWIPALWVCLNRSSSRYQRRTAGRTEPLPEKSLSQSNPDNKPCPIIRKPTLPATAMAPCLPMLKPYSRTANSAVLTRSTRHPASTLAPRSITATPIRT
ncbi:hypothetical protein [Endozoicomonas sp. YOMI1]|uniref:hypothetical protein n=1 Tax=Endozoicomonas sp. YOMI1 TaxID=2828739 RepID=UPI002147A31A|nr:hypothetical protein [Endozoicomonas sp. YOMI1]